MACPKCGEKIVLRYVHGGIDGIYYKCPECSYEWVDKAPVFLVKKDEHHAENVQANTGQESGAALAGAS